MITLETVFKSLECILLSNDFERDININQNFTIKILNCREESWPNLQTMFGILYPFIGIEVFPIDFLHLESSLRDLELFT
jgi:hypothetical protein